MCSCLLSARPYALAIAGAVIVFYAVSAAWADDAKSLTSPTLQSAELEKLIRDLGDPEFIVRERATNRLAKLGIAAFDALAAAESHSDPEVALRARELLRSMRIRWIQDGDPPEIKQVLADYDRLSVIDRATRIERELAPLPTDLATAALCRVARYERSGVLSKRAAVAIFDRPPPEGDTLAGQLKAIETNLGQSTRPAAQWLRAHVAYHRDPPAAIAVWDKLAAAESQLLKTAPQDTDRTVATALWRRLYRMLLAQNRRGDTPRVLGELVELQPTDETVLSRFVQWLTEQQEWSTIDAVAQKFQKQFERQPILLYLLAQAQKLQGKTESAEKTAAQAAGLMPDQSMIHLAIAHRLQDMGLFPWAEREYRGLIDRGPPESRDALRASLLLAIMHEDQAQYEAAAETRRKLLELLDNNAEARQTMSQWRSLGGDLRELRARLEYAYACHQRQKGDISKEIEHLDNAVQHDPSDADVLIALYRLPNQDAARRAATLKHIRRAADKFESQITTGESAELLQNADAYNQYAWLIANTEGDFDKALRYSKLSIEIASNRAGYLDTLARCHYAKGDLASAVQHQAKAAKLEPHSGAIARQLKQFQKELETRQKAKQP
jgi:tetratricopeptide (TPR) repeat protein